MHEQAFTYNELSYGATIGVLIFAINIVMTLIYNRCCGRMDRRGCTVKTRHFRAAHSIQVILKLLVAAVMLFPILWSFLCSFKTETEIFRFRPTLPESLNFENYRNVWESNLPLQMWNSVKISLYTIAGTLLLSTLAGYGFSRSNWKGMNVLLYILIGTQMIPGLSNVITLYITGNKLNALNTHWYVALITSRPMRQPRSG